MISKKFVSLFEEFVECAFLMVKILNREPDLKGSYLNRVEKQG